MTKYKRLFRTLVKQNKSFYFFEFARIVLRESYILLCRKINVLYFVVRQIMEQIKLTKSSGTEFHQVPSCLHKRRNLKGHLRNGKRFSEVNTV